MAFHLSEIIITAWNNPKHLRASSFRKISGSVGEAQLSFKFSLVKKKDFPGLSVVYIHLGNIVVQINRG